MSSVSEDKSSRKKKVGVVKSGYLAFNDELVPEDNDLDCFAACSDPVPAPLPKSNRMSSVVNRRRSSMGIAGSRRGSISEAEQVRIVDMYKTVIQMSSENKLTEKNSWQYDLIDHMGRLIKDESSGVNFQKASCTLDASVKIYSNRVDDTYASSHRILESLSRNGAQPEEEEGEMNADGTRERPKAKVGSKAASSRLNATDTIERNPTALNAVKLENDYAFDPTFHKLSKAFDEGGAKGMLLYNMRVATTDCSLAFTRAADSKAPSKASGAKAPLVDMRDLVERSGLTVEKVRPLQTCSRLQEYRNILGISPSPSASSSNKAVLSSASLASLHRFESLESLPFSSTLNSPTTTRDSVDNSPDSIIPSSALGANSTPARPIHSHVPFAGNSDGNMTPVAFQSQDYDVMPDDGGIGDFWSPVYAVDEPALRSPVHAALSSVPGAQGAGMLPGMKLRWSTDGQNHADQIRENQRALQNSLEALQVNTADEYAYFDLDALASGGNNAWAGAQHWKYATRSRQQASQPIAAAPESASVAVDEQAKKPAAKAKKASKKDVQSLVFTLDLVDDSKFVSSKGRTDTTIMTKAAQQKAVEESTALLLPVDEKVQVKDLCRLSLWPQVVVLPKNVHPLSITGSGKTTGKKGGTKNRAQLLVDFMTGEEAFWSVPHSGSGSVDGGSVAGSDIVPVPIRFSGRQEEDQGNEGTNYDYEDFGGGAGDFYDDDVAREDISSHTAPIPQEPLTGLNINQHNLVQADRQVEKIQIKYEKVSKRVNVHKLKGDILGHIQEKLDGPTRNISSREETTTKTISFQDMVKDLGGSMQQKDVTLPYYFICLLHLANEQTLKISDREDLSDLIVQFD